LDIRNDSEYIFVMTKHLVDIDDELLERARASAGTATLKATVEVALRTLSEHATVLQHIRRLRRKSTLSRKAIEASRAPRVRSRG
jgi:Arc/MetJ family transcription regulator